VGESGRDPVRVVRFDLAQFEQQPVIFGVAGNRIIEDMITIVVEVDLLFEFCVPLLDGLTVHFNHCNFALDKRTIG